MIAHLRGIISKGVPGEATVDVQGVGYRVHMPLNDWDSVLESANVRLFISTYVREDRFDLFGFLEERTRTLFERFIELNGIGPRMGLELCAVPRAVLSRAVQQNDPALLVAIKGIGRKTAEKLLVELKSLAERAPSILLGGEQITGARYDPDAIAALTQLGFAPQDIMHSLETLPKELATTEERVAAALRTL